MRPSPEFCISRHKEPSLAIKVILVTKEMNIFLSFGKLYCFILPWECKPNFFPRQKKRLIHVIIKYIKYKKNKQVEKVKGT